MFGKHEVLIAKGELTRPVLLQTALVRQEAPRRNKGIAVVIHEPSGLKRCHPTSVKVRETTMTKIQSTLCFLAMASMFGWGCSNNRAATPDANSSQPSSSASSSNSNTTANADQKFVEDAAKGNRAEVELGKMVAAKATNPAVKQFAQRMVKDHTEALNQLQQLAQSKNITLPDGLPSDAQDLQQKLSNDHGKQLDSDYMSGMVEDHEKDVHEFQDAAQNLKDPDLKQWASKTLPILQQHCKWRKQSTRRSRAAKQLPVRAGQSVASKYG